MVRARRVKVRARIGQKAFVVCLEEDIVDAGPRNSLAVLPVRSRKSGPQRVTRPNRVEHRMLQALQEEVHVRGP